MADDTIIPTLLIDATYRVQIDDVETYRGHLTVCSKLHAKPKIQ